MKILLTTAVLTLLQSAMAINNGLGLKPAMGWNTWNKYGCDINEQVIISNADEIIKLGLDKLGYVYVNIDDCWQLPDRDADGKVQVDMTKFPRGMEYVGEYLHNNTLLFGIYSSAGTMTCQRKAGSLGFEQQDADSYASWGVDYLKYDNCYNMNISSKIRYPVMSEALNKTGRPIYYSLCQWGEENVWEWAAEYANSWRSTLDIENKWAVIKFNHWQQKDLASYAGPGGWNDPDMLEIGNNNLTMAESRTHFALWCFIKAPLILGNNLTNMTAEELAIISNKDLIAIN